MVEPAPAQKQRPGRVRENAETRLLYRITKALLDRQTPLEAALEEVVHHLAEYGFVRTSIAIYDQPTREVRIEASHGLSQDELRRGRYQPGEGIIGQVVEDGEAAVVPAIAEEPQFLDRTGSRAGVDRARTAFICAPIVNPARREVVGTVSVDIPVAQYEDVDAGLQWDRRLLTVLGVLLGEAVRHWRDQREEDEARGRDRLELNRRELLPELPRTLVGNSRPMREVALQVSQVAPTDVTVLVRGESGTGKEVVARAIHAASPRVDGPFVSVNCGALPEQLVESELFGHVRGAFTGATNTRRGRFEMASGGTIFLDEIGELPLGMQVKLLRTLQEGEIHRVGEETPRRVDVRIIAATNKELEAEIEAGRFRDDLFYRLNIFPVYLPPLRERHGDVMLLADHFVEKLSARQGRPVSRISTPAIDLMCAYHWPGNARELENCIERAVLLAADGVIREHHLPPTLQTGASSGTSQAGSLEGMMMSFEREILIEAMKDAGGNMTAAARALSTTPRILAYRLRKHDLHERLAVLRRRNSD